MTNKQDVPIGTMCGSDKAKTGDISLDFREVVENSADAIVLHKADGEILYANRAALASLNYDDADSLLGRSIYEIFAEKDRAQYSAFVERIIKSLKSFMDVEFTLTCQDEESFIVSISCFPVVKSGKVIVGLDFRDITARKLLEAGYKKQIEVAHEKYNSLAKGKQQKDRVDASLAYRIVIIYSSYLMQTALKDLLDDEKLECKYVKYYDEYDISLLNRLNPDVAVFAFSKSGDVEVSDIRELARRRKSLPIIVACMQAPKKMEQEMIKAGVSGFISKEEDFRLFPAAINAVASGELWHPRSAMQKVIENYREFTPAEATLEERQSILTAREKEILQLIAQSYRNKDIAEKLGISYYTVVSHIYNIYRKLEVNRRIDAIHYAISHKMIEIE